MSLFVEGGPPIPEGFVEVELEGGHTLWLPPADAARLEAQRRRRLLAA